MTVDPCRIPAGSFPVFSGAPGEDIEVFFLEFDSACEAYGFPPVERCENLLDTDFDQSCSSPVASSSRLLINDRDALRYRFLRKSLRKEASRFLLACDKSVVEDYVQLRTVLVDHFLPKENSSLFRVKLRHRRRSPNECLVKLATDIRLMTARAYPSATSEVIDDIAKEAFIDALDPPIKDKVIDFDPQTLDAAQRRALVVETNLQKSSTVLAAAAAEFASVSQVRAPSKTFDEDELVERVAERVSKILLEHQKPASSRPRSPSPERRDFKRPHSSESRSQMGDRRSDRRISFREPPVCFFCQRRGHIERDCFTKKRSQNSQHFGDRSDSRNSLNRF